jgi:hypothetical protein
LVAAIGGVFVFLLFFRRKGKKFLLAGCLHWHHSLSLFLSLSLSLSLFLSHSLSLSLSISLSLSLSVSLFLFLVRWHAGREKGWNYAGISGN